MEIENQTDKQAIVADETPAEKPAESAEKTLEDLVPAEQAPVEKKADKSESLIVELKREKKELARKVAELEAKHAKDGDDDELDDDLDALAKEFDVDPKFAKRLKSSILAETKAESDKLLAPLREADKARQQVTIRNSLSEQFDTLANDFPELSNHNKEAFIKYTLAVTVNDPNERKKPVSQLVEEMYGITLKGRGSEGYGASPRGGEDTINYSKPTDKDYKRVAKKMEANDGSMSDDDFQKMYGDII